MVSFLRREESYIFSEELMAKREKYADTIDWDQYWMIEKESPEMTEAAKRIVERLGKFMHRIHVETFADFGCGPAPMLFRLAKEYPLTEFFGYDSSVPMIAKNRRRARDLGLPNIGFGREVLPEISSKRTYDIVMCIATLFYVREIERAIVNLFSRVNRGGYLIFNYPNVASTHWYRSNIRTDDAENRKRFSLVLNGNNLFSLRRIEEALGKRPYSFWKAVSEFPKPGNVCVYVQKS